MKALHLTVALSLLLIFSGCSSISVNQDYNQEYNFQNLHTYNWLDNSQTLSNDARINNDLVKDRMINAINTTLQAKGYTKVPKEEASFLVSWHGAIDTKLQVQTIDHYYRPYGYGSRGAHGSFMNSRTKQTIASEYEVGTLLIDILDPVGHKLVWRGTGQGVIQGKNTPEKITENINNAVKEILAQFPPTPKK